MCLVFAARVFDLAGNLGAPVLAWTGPLSLAAAAVLIAKNWTSLLTRTAAVGFSTTPGPRPSPRGGCRAADKAVAEAEDSEVTRSWQMLDETRSSQSSLGSRELRRKEEYEHASGT